VNRDHLDKPDSDPARCAFCAYLAGRRRYAIVRRSDLVAVMVTREPRGYPHALVTTVRHCPTILDLTDAEASEIFIAAREAARAIDDVFRRPGIAVWQNNGLAAHQAIGHIHIHVAGTLDGGGTRWGPVQERPLAEAEQIANCLRGGLTRWPADLV
jgi:histidine triad (HIT) family protein